MVTQRSHLKDTLEHGGYSRETPIPAESDRQYNNSLRNSRGKTPYAPATQTRDVLAEHLTRDKKIIAFNHENKLCKAGEVSRSKGIKVTCPGHPGCTATMAASDNVGDEKNGGSKLGRMLLSGDEPISVDKLTTDADGKMFEGFSTEMVGSGQQTEHFLDIVHLNRSVRGAISRANIKPVLETSEPTTYRQRSKAVNRLADSLSWRAEGEVRAARIRYADHEELVTRVARAIPAVIKCYEGDHSLCRKLSLVCDGMHTKYEYIPQYACGAFRFSDQDAKLIANILKKRMGREALIKTRFGFTTQKSESTNHAFATTNPKHTMTCSRNAVNRDHSSIHMINNPVGDSILQKARTCGVPIDPNSPCLQTLLKMNKRQCYQRERSKSDTCKNRRTSLRRKRYQSYDHKHNESFYIKDQLDPK
jgi:hypothetical protein